MIRALPALALALLTTGCHIEEGSGHLEEQIRFTTAFDRISVSGDIEQVYVERCDDCEPRVRVRGDDNLVPHVVTGVSGTTLEISNDGWLIPKLPLEVSVRAPATTRINLSGAAIVELDGVADRRFDARVSGSGDLTLIGQTAHFEADVSGSGTIRAFELKADVGDVSVSGSGRVEICASTRLDASVSGSGDVRYDCAPQSIGRNVTGSGSIRGR